MLENVGGRRTTEGPSPQVIETEEDRKKNPQARWHWSELSIGTVIQVPLPSLEFRI